jgi:uncharacterized protein with FMN-binding domain
VSAPAPRVVAPAAASVVSVAPTAAIDREPPHASAPPSDATITAPKAAASVPASAPKKDASAPSPLKDVTAKAKTPHEAEHIVPSPASSSTTEVAAQPAAPDAMSSARPAALPSAPALTTSNAPVVSSSAYKDGTYTGWGTCRHGDIQATVVVASGRITSATISQCLTRYPCSWIEALPPQVVQRQSAEVDYVSGATQSADAFYGAVTDALSKAK